MLPVSALLRSLGRLIFPGRPFTKSWARHSLHHAEEVLARRDRDLKVAILGRDCLSRLLLLLVVSHQDEARA